VQDTDGQAAASLCPAVLRPDPDGRPAVACFRPQKRTRPRSTLTAWITAPRRLRSSATGGARLRSEPSCSNAIP